MLSQQNLYYHYDNHQALFIVYIHVLVKQIILTDRVRQKLSHSFHLPSVKPRISWQHFLPINYADCQKSISFYKRRGIFPSQLSIDLDLAPSYNHF